MLQQRYFTVLRRDVLCNYGLNLRCVYQEYLLADEIADPAYVEADRQGLIEGLDVSRKPFEDQAASFWGLILSSSFKFTFNDELISELETVTTEEMVQILHQYFQPTSPERRKISFR